LVSTGIFTVIHEDIHVEFSELTCRKHKRKKQK